MGQRRVDLRAVAALAAWAGLALVDASGNLEQVLGRGTFWAKAVSEAIAGALLLGWGLGRRGRMPSGRGWSAMALLAIAGVVRRLLWRPYIDGVLHVRYVRSATQGMVLLAVPLFLALLSAVRWVPEAVPRKTVGAALAGVAGYCLLLTADEMSVRLDEAPALLLTALFAVALVWVWSLARRSLARGSTTIVAGCGLLVSAAISGLAASQIPIEPTHTWAWSEVWWPLTGTAVCTGAESMLWFWLLQRLELAAFSMQQVAVWTIVVLAQVVLFGFLSWRLDLALALGVAAIWTALRARVEDEDPVRLGLAGVGPG